MTDNKATQSKKSGLRKWIIGGVLTAVAAGVFVSASGLRGAANENAFSQLPDAQSQNLAIKQEGNAYPALTKDNKLLRINMDVKALERGPRYPTDDAFQQYLAGQAQMALMGEVIKYNATEIPANIGNIQQAVAQRIALMIPIDNVGGQITRAQEGVNFTAPTITKISDGTGDTTLWQAPSSNPIARGLGL